MSFVKKNQKVISKYFNKPWNTPVNPKILAYLKKMAPIQYLQSLNFLPISVGNCGRFSGRGGDTIYRHRTTVVLRKLSVLW